MTSFEVCGLGAVGRVVTLLVVVLVVAAVWMALLLMVKAPGFESFGRGCFTLTPWPRPTPARGSKCNAVRKSACKGSPEGTGGSEYLELHGAFSTSLRARWEQGSPSRSGFLAWRSITSQTLLWGLPTPYASKLVMEMAQLCKGWETMEPFPTLRTAAWKTLIKLASPTFPRPRRRYLDKKTNSSCCFTQDRGQNTPQEVLDAAI